MRFLLFLMIPLSVWAAPYAYPPASYRTPICFPYDWQKSLVNERGDLCYDYGPGPYSHPGTRIAVALQGIDMTVESQTLVDARSPIVLTDLQSTDVMLELEAFALADSPALEPVVLSNSGEAIARSKGFTGAIAWAVPSKPADPAFRNVGWGTGRPICYTIDVEPGSRKQVILGFCDSYRQKGKIPRVMQLEVEGETARTIDLLVLGEQGQPQVFDFAAADIDGDGKIDITVRAAPHTTDPNVILNVIWVFAPEQKIDPADLIAGRLNYAAELMLDCGNEPQLKQTPLRRDALLARFSEHDQVPIIRITTRRDLNWESASAQLHTDGRPYLQTRPAASRAVANESGWELEFPAGTREIEILVNHTFRRNIETLSFPDLQQEKKRALFYWHDSAAVPIPPIRVPDTRVQNLLDAALRVLYQVGDIVDGYRQFQPGPTVYRGFWASDGSWDADAALLAGDFEMARLTLDRFFEHQMPSGRIKIMSPALLHRETSHILWLIPRYVELTGDSLWLAEHYHHLKAAANHLGDLRQQALADPQAIYYGLLPPGLTDGGIGGVNAEYGGVYWTLIGLKSAIKAANLLSNRDDSERWQTEFDALLSAFYRAAQRDLQTDTQGNTYLPMKMGLTEPIPDPQRGQGQLLQAVFPGDIFTLKDPFVAGLLNIYRQNLAENLALDTGWLKDGVWPFHAAHRGLAQLWLGLSDEAIQSLWGLVEHAAPTLVWVEEQLPRHLGTRTSGDSPQTNANAQLIRLLRHLLVLERDKQLEIFPALPEEWVFPGAELKLDQLPTAFGSLELSLSIDAEGQKARLEVQLANRTAAVPDLVLRLERLHEKGFQLVDLPDHSGTLRLSGQTKVHLDLVTKESP
ncbi:hypothetical protein JW992_08720 [candidate division KSB1 bacterium]|nr:hypothetical protein [candidate division KSB1 bacterium]